MSTYWEILELTLEQFIRDLKKGKIEGVKLEYADHDGNVVSEEEGRPRIYDGKNYAWLYKGRKGMGIKRYYPNEISSIREKIEEEYGELTWVHETELGILHISL